MPDGPVIANNTPPSEDEFEQLLLAKGLLSEIKPPLTDLAPYRHRRLVETKGKPLSEVILEERR
ncbi:MAG: hypothetical protein EXR62_09070 [Chloroflexi bacterium]|nr:hypothetical protein [Chloroflexota bacterium]